MEYVDRYVRFVAGGSLTAVRELVSGALWYTICLPSLATHFLQLLIVMSSVLYRRLSQENQNSLAGSIWTAVNWGGGRHHATAGPNALKY